jgi:hypothetical protein
MNSRQIDHSFLGDKIALRIKNIPLKQKLFVLDAFGGDGQIWNTIEKRYPGDIAILRCDQKPNKKGVYLRGNNLKFLRSLDLSRFDVIDLDAYGYPYAQLQELFMQHAKNPLNVIVFVTAIQVNVGALPYRMLVELNYTMKMIKKIPTLFTTNGIEKMKRYLANHGVTKITRRSFGRKHYFCFGLKKDLTL